LPLHFRSHFISKNHSAVKVLNIMSPTSSNLTYFNYAAVRRNHWVPYIWHSSQTPTLLTQIRICFNKRNFALNLMWLFSYRSLSLAPLMRKAVISAKFQSSCRSNKNILFTSTCWSIHGYQGMIDHTTLLLLWVEGFISNLTFGS